MPVDAVQNRNDSQLDIVLQSSPEVRNCALWHLCTASKLYNKAVRSREGGCHEPQNTRNNRRSVQGRRPGGADQRGDCCATAVAIWRMRSLQCLDGGWRWMIVWVKPEGRRGLAAGCNRKGDTL